MISSHQTEVVTRLLASGEAKLVPWDDRYAVTKSGDVFSRAGNRVRYAKHWRKKAVFKSGTRRAYFYCHLSDNAFSFGVHTLVAKVFMGAPEKNQEVRHLDGNPANNNLSNLAYGTRKENMADAIKHGSTNRGVSLSCPQRFSVWSVLNIRNMAASGYSQRHISKMTGHPEKSIWGIIHRKSWNWIEEGSQQSKTRKRYRNS